MSKMKASDGLGRESHIRPISPKQAQIVSRSQTCSTHHENNKSYNAAKPMVIFDILSGNPDIHSKKTRHQVQRHKNGTQQSHLREQLSYLIVRVEGFNLQLGQHCSKFSFTGQEHRILNGVCLVLDGMDYRSKSISDVIDQGITEPVGAHIDIIFQLSHSSSNVCRMRYRREVEREYTIAEHNDIHIDRFKEIFTLAISLKRMETDEISRGECQKPWPAFSSHCLSDKRNPATKLHPPSGIGFGKEFQEEPGREYLERELSPRPQTRKS
ncbi:hypothetical protein OGATHE_004561 [Ogataea polymorpha]|uniref:Uncharacterized protein n=1 Tax=Ogataea polymorpha TaxID=460523 RepID=A0A9P8P0A8_9ASCO|nr:hypothetical protein OGATHE_004561 [Ogataea polymorpha]